MRIFFHVVLFFAQGLLPLASSLASVEVNNPPVDTGSSIVQSADNDVTSTPERIYQSKNATVPMPKLPTSKDSIEDFLNPALFQNERNLKRIRHALRSGRPVVIRNAFRIEFAEAVYADLVNNIERFSLHTTIQEGRPPFQFQHHNIYDDVNYTRWMNATGELFESPRTKAFISDLSGRECSGETWPTASLYRPGDYSLPHTDYADQRTVAYVWHLTKDWEMHYGGHLYWCEEHFAHSYVYTSFNTLILFSVTPRSSHAVTLVNEEAGDKLRLALNSWWTDPWPLSFDPEDDENYPFVEDYYDTEERLLELTSDQADDLTEMAELCEKGEQPDYVSEDRCERIIAMYEAHDEIVDPEEAENVLVVTF